MPRRKNQDAYVKEKLKEELAQNMPTFEEAKEERIKLLQQTLDEYDPFDVAQNIGRNDLMVVTIAFQPLLCFTNTIKKTISDLAITFDLFQKLVSMLNTKIKYIPMINDFCRLLGISRSTYSKYKAGEDGEYENIMYMIEDYIGGFMLQGAMNGSIKEVSAMFTAKSTLGYKDTPDNVVNNNLIIPTKEATDLYNDYMKNLVVNKDTGKRKELKDLD